MTKNQSLVPEWQWCSWNGSSYLTCSLLANWQHGFFTGESYPQTPDRLIAAFDPDAEVYRLKQVHGKIVLTPKEINLASQQAENNTLVDGDGLVTDGLRQSVWVASADCNSVLIADISSGKVAAVHAGWRGTSLKIVPEAIARFLIWGSSLKDLRVVMGPAISGEVYQVGEKVAAEVGATIVCAAAAQDSQAILAKLSELPVKLLLADDKPGRVRLDIRLVNQIQLEQLGINREQIAIAPYCTYKNDRFCSYRRTKKKEVQWSGIVSN
ncbi:peptidoglycan editing factor PgeF [Myxosarcina sp. GI1]|uniref:peptidoglycan editing factor PgeF n=1 Tax=Myxosarcina sp. GI1 TaxID=1541065 RepID=UPI00055B3B03|nr:peptidoglycan editing factor PgeF [Myxosarcina sp. GI1]